VRVRELVVLLLIAAGARHAGAQQEHPVPQEEVVKPPATANTSKDFVRFAFNFYSQTDGGGNPHLEEDMVVLEPQVLVGQQLSERWFGTLKVQSDIISAASVDKDNRFPPGTQSGASGDKYFGVEASGFYAWSDQTTVGGGLSLSTEYDYTSAGGYLRWTHDTASHNDTFVVRVSAFFDTLDLILFDGTEPGTDTRQSFSLGLGWTHVIGPRTLGTLNWDLTTQTGFLSTPYNSVVAAGTEVQETLPDTRFRNSLFGRVRHLLFDDFAVEPGVGAYFDDWGAAAFTTEINFAWEVLPGDLIIRTGYRFHSQTEVDHFVPDTATSIPEFRTQDSDLADFTSHTIGLKFLLPRPTFIGDKHEVELGVDYTMRSDNLDAYSLTLGYQWRF
jgi:uncharacterized protein DUF3570